MLQFLNSSVFELLHRASLRNLMKKVLSLVSLATAKRVGELQAVSRMVSFVCSDACLMCQSLSPRLSPFPIPFLALSWWLPRRILRLGWTMNCCCALSVPSVFIWTGPPLFLLFLAVFFCPLGGLLTLCRRMPFLSFCGRSSMGLVLLGRR